MFCKLIPVCIPASYVPVEDIICVITWCVGIRVRRSTFLIVIHLLIVGR